MIIHSKRLIFVHIQKTGGNSVASALGAFPDCPEKHFLARDLRTLYGTEVWANYFKFAFVRNPWDRLVSWWSMIEARREDFLRGSSLNNFQTFILSRATNFQEFLENCDEEVIDHDGKKWIYRNQIDYLTDPFGRMMLDFVGRFETIQTDFEIATKRALGCAPDLPHENVSLHDHYSKYYSPRLAEKVRQRFRKDIETFGYVFEC